MAGVELHVEGDRATIAFSRDFDFVVETAAQHLLQVALADGAATIVIDLCDAPFTGAPGVRLAVMAARSGCAVVVRGHPAVHRLFQVTGTDRLVELQPCPPVAV